MIVRTETPSDIDAAGFVLWGDPNYRERFVFRNIPRLGHEGIPPEVLLALPFTDEVPRGVVEFHEGFRAVD